MQMRKFRPLALINHNQGVFGLNLGRVLGEAVLLEQIMTSLLALHAEGSIRPVISRVFPFDDPAAAHRFLHERKNVGKVLLEL